MGRAISVRALAFLIMLLTISGSTLVCTGEEGMIQEEAVRVIQVAAYKDTTVVLKSDGTVWGWGENSFGMLGEDRDKYVRSPERLEGFESINAIAMGNGYLLAVKNDGTVLGIGKNDVGIINPDKIGKSIERPSRISELTEIRAVSAGINYAMALKEDGSVFIWGDYRYKSSQAFNNPPRNVTHAKGAEVITASRYNAFVIDKDRKAWFLRGYLHRPEKIENLEEVAQIYESDRLTYAVSADGSLWYWTINGQYTNRLEGPAGVDKLAAYGAGGMLALDSTGHLWKWDEEELKPNKVEEIDGIMDIAAGDSHMIALKKDGTLWAWGENGRGQLGDGGAYLQRIPIEVVGLQNATMISASSDFAAALLSDGTVWTWGNNSSGQLGTGTREDSLQPVKVEGINGIKLIATGESHMVALKEDGTVWAWGSNSSGELGDATYEDRLLPVQTTELKRIASVSAGNGYSTALTVNGAVWAWGNSSYEPKKAKKKKDISKPVRVEELSAITAIDAGSECVLAVNRAGNVSGWGNNFNGQLGISPGKDDNIREKPRAISGFSYIKAVSLGGGHGLSLSWDGEVKAWGSNGFRQLGNDRELKFSSPRTIECLENIVSVSAAGNQSFAVDKAGKLWVWGDNSQGQLGPNLGNVINQPVEANYIYDVKQVACSESYTLALTGNGRVMGWGFNDKGQLGVGSKSSSYVEKPKQITVP